MPTSNNHVAYGKTTLPNGIRSRFIQDINGLTMHILEAGFEESSFGDADLQQPTRPCVLLLHGFPELAYSWRKIMLPLAEAGFHVVAPDQRGYGQTVSLDNNDWDSDYDGDLASFRLFNLVTDAVALVYALGHRSVAAVVGHDFGSPVAAYCALIRPDVFRSVVLMSAPFGGPPELPLGTAEQSDERCATAGPTIHEELAALPRPRKHYQWYYSTREANANMQHAPQGIHSFLRAYYHHKSADWPQNRPYPLESWSAPELAKLPTYYIMDLDQGMAETVAPEMPSPAEIAACRWLTDEELQVYSQEFGRTGFQGGLQWYRCGTDPSYTADLRTFANRTIDVPATFIAGKSDWGVYQKPGAFEAMQWAVCTRMEEVHLVEGAGHWVQQERAGEVVDILVKFLGRNNKQ